MSWSGGLLIAGTLLCTSVTGCGRLGFEVVSDAAALDAGIDASFDAGVDPSLDAGLDAGRDAGGGDASCAPAGDPCLTLPSLPAEAVLDGVLDPCLTLRPVTPVGWTGTLPLPPQIQARAAFAWRRDGIYAYVEVDDPDLHPAPAADGPYCGDGVEIYIDTDGVYGTPGDYDFPGTAQFIAAAPETASGRSGRGGQWIYQHVLDGSWPAARFAMVGRPGGYAFETLVEGPDLGLGRLSLAAGQHVGIDLAINVSTPDGSPGTGSTSCGVRIGQYFMRVVPAMGALCGTPVCDTRAFCVPELL